MNRLLLRQVNKCISNPLDVPQEIQQLLMVISESYDHHEKDRRMLERSIELTSEELIDLNTQLLQEAKELRQKEIHLNASQHIARVGSWEFDEFTGALTWSDETYRIFDYEPGAVAVTLELFYSHVHPDDLEDLKMAVSTAIEAKGFYSIVHRLISGKTVHERAEIFFDKTGKAIKMTGTVQDITERIEAQRALERANKELTALFENMEELFFSVDTLGNTMIQISHACGRIYGRYIDEFMQNPNLWLELVHPEYKELVRQRYLEMNKGQSFREEYKIIHKDNEIRWVETRLTPTFDRDGNICRIDGMTADITKRKEAEIAFRNSEYQFRSLIENSADAIMIVNERSEIQFASNSFYRLMGYTPGDVFGKASFEQIYPDDINALQSHLKNVLNHPGKPITITYRRVKKDGSIIWCEGVATNLLHKPEVNGIIVNFRDITERIEADKALRDSEHKFHSLIQNSTDAITVLNEKMEVTFASDSILGVTGFTAEEVISTNSLDFIHPDDVLNLKKKFKRAMSRNERVVTVEYRRRKKDGSYIWCEGTAVNLLNDPTIAGIVINFRDITERKKYEEALKLSERKLRGLIENSAEAIIITDSEFYVTFASDSLFRVAGYKPSDILGFSIFTLAHPDEKEMLTNFMDDVKRSPGVAKKIVYKTRKKNNEYIWCERVTINLLDDPAINGIVSNFSDITERIEAEKALKDSEHKFRSLIQNSSDAITIADKNGIRIFASESIVNLTGYKSEEVIGLPLFSMVDSDSAAVAKEFLRELYAHPGVTKSIIYKAKKKDGSYIWCERISTNLLHDPAIDGIISNIRDITDRKEKEEALQASNQELLKRNQELDRFVYSVSHDLRAPLTSILGLTQLTKMATSLEEAVENLDMIQMSAERLDTFIRDILNYSRNARIAIVKEKIDFNHLIADITNNLKFANTNFPTIRLSEEIENGAEFYSDRTRINIIVNNLMSNAIKYAAPDRDPVIQISIKVCTDYVDITIEDNGIGIDSKYHDRIFEMFFRATATSVGSGLGLYIVKESVKKLGGTVTFNSAPNRGTTFSVTIPNL